MSNPQPITSIVPLKIIAGAMMFGMLSFVGVAAFLVEGGSMTTDRSLVDTLLLVLIVMAVGEFGAYLALRSVMMSRGQIPNPPTVNSPIPAQNNPFGVYSTITIIGCAMAEGLGLFGTVIYLITGEQLALIAPAAALFAIFLQWPSEEKAKRFMPPGDI